MGRYRVFGILSASVVVGEYEANSPEEAKALADKDQNANWMPSLCHQCAKEVDLGDICETEAEEI